MKGGKEEAKRKKKKKKKEEDGARCMSLIKAGIDSACDDLSFGAIRSHTNLLGDT